MAKFTYTAAKSDNEPYKGVAEAKDRFELYEIIRREGGHVVSVTEENTNSVWSMHYWNAKFAKVGEYDKILFARNLSAMISAGLSMSRALAVIERQTKNIKLQDTYADIASEVRRGQTLHESLQKQGSIFSPIFIAMVRAGEEGGDVPGSLKVLADQMESMYELNKKIKGAMMYPMVILVAIIGIGAFMMVQVVPTLADVFIQMKAVLPLPTRVIIGMSSFLKHNTLTVVAGAVVSFLILKYGLKTRQGMLASDWTFLHMPIIGGIVREINAARTARTLSSMLSSGVDVISALDITGDVVQNYYFHQVIMDAQKRVKGGEALSVAFARNDTLYPPFVAEMMAVGEETGATNDMLKRLAIFYEEEVNRKTKDMSTIIEPFLMLFIGGAVGFFAVSMIAPIYQLTQNI